MYTREDFDIAYDPNLEDQLGRAAQATADAQEVITQVQGQVQQVQDAATGAVAGNRITGSISSATIPLASVVGAGVMAALGKAANVAANATAISSPPTQSEVQSLQTTINAIISSLIAANHMNP